VRADCQVYRRDPSRLAGGMTETSGPERHGTRSHKCTLVPGVDANRVLDADASEPEIVRERWHASRLPSRRSALRGLHPHHVLPMSWHLSERRLSFVERSLRGFLLTTSWAHRRAEPRFMSVMPHASPA
jgi:hypothetical protein